MLPKARFVPVVLATFLVAAPSFAGAPPTSFSKSVQSLDAVDRVTMPSMDNAALVRAAEAEDSRVPPSPYRFAETVSGAWTTTQHGSWEGLDDGSWIWRLVVESSGALNLNLGFGRFDIPEGASLWLYTPNRTHVLGPFTSRDRSSNGSLWTPLVPGERLIVEVHSPNAGDYLELSSVGHGFRDLPLKQGSCNIDVACSEADPWRNQVRSAIRYLRSGAFLCSGQMINNTGLDQTPYMLTAYHCGIRNNTDDSVVVYWVDEAQLCGNLGSGNHVATQTGTTVVAGHGPTDFSLVRLNQPPPSIANAYFSGWDRQGVAPPSSFSIHHPTGDSKAISFDTDPAISSNFPLTNFGGPISWLVRWNQGTTEGGSSGSCLWNPQGLCVGQLWGGFASCSALNEPDYYGRFDLSWTGGGTPTSRLSDWLDPSATGQMTLDGLEAGGGGSCTPSATSACLVGGRFKVELDWRPTNGTSSAAQVFQGFDSDLSTLLHFGNAENLEFLVKMLDACNTSFNSFWVFAAGTTNVEFTLTVTDTETSAVKTYFNPLGTAAPAITDTEAFMTCP